MIDTKTLAELDALIAKLQAERDAMPEHEWKVGDKAYVSTTVKDVEVPEISSLVSRVGVDGWKSGTDRHFFTPRHSLIPTADMITRAEHERLMQAEHERLIRSFNTLTPTPEINAESAVTHLVSEYVLDVDFKGSEFRPQIYTHDVGTVKYAVTVSRKAAVPVAVPDAEPECWVNISDNGYYYGYKSRGEAEMFNGTCKLSSFPLYRHPAPAEASQYALVAPQGFRRELWELIKTSFKCINESRLLELAAANKNIDNALAKITIVPDTNAAQPVAVASQSVIEEIREAAFDAIKWSHEYDANPGLSYTKITAALAKITPLPEPDRFWLGQMNRPTHTPCVFIFAPGNDIGVGIDDIPGFCAALIAKGKEAGK